MSHEIKTAVFSEAEGAGWTGLGQTIPAEIAKDPKAILNLLQADYSVRKVPAFVKLGDDDSAKHVEIPNRSALVGRWNNDPNTDEVFEVTSSNRYHVDYRQPVDVIEAFRDELAKETLEISHAAVLKGGRIITVCGRLKGQDIALNGGTDNVLSYVTGMSGYDKQHGTSWFKTGIRTVCNNTLEMGLSDAEGAGRLFRVTAATRLNKDSLRDLLERSISTTEKEGALYDSLTQVKLTDDEARIYFATILDIDLTMLNARNADGRPVISTRSQNQLNALLVAYKKGPGSHLDTANGTLFGALNALTYIVDHEAGIRDTMKDGNDKARMTSATFGAGAAAKARALRLAASRLQAVAA